MSFEIVRLDHVQLAMPPGREAEAGGLLLRPPRAHARAQARGPGGTGRVLVRAGPGGPAPGGGGGLPARPQAHPALVVRDLPALEAALRSAGVEVRPNPDTAPAAGGLRRRSLRQPD